MQAVWSSKVQRHLTLRRPVPLLLAASRAPPFLNSAEPLGLPESRNNTRQRLTPWLIPRDNRTWRPRLKRIPWTPEGAKIRVDARYEPDEAGVLGFTELALSKLRGIFSVLRLDRSTTCGALGLLSHSRVFQATL